MVSKLKILICIYVLVRDGSTMQTFVGKIRKMT